MKAYRLLPLLVILFFACNRGLDTPGADNLDHTPVPSGSPVTTKFTAYVFPLNPPPGFLWVNTETFQYTHHLLVSGAITTDKYNTRLNAGNAADVGVMSNYRLVPVTASSRNYVDVKLVERHHVGFIYTCCGSTWPLPGGATVKYPDNSFNPLPTSTSGAYAGNLDPAATDFSFIIPASFADFDDKRWYLRAFGALRLAWGEAFTIKAGADVMLTLPISPAMVAEATDSIEAWYFDNRWVKKGYAKKVNNTYTKAIDRQGLWSFAKPVNGKYINLKIHTVNNIPVHNAVVKIKNQNMEIAGGRTDADGNFFCFVPTNIPLDLTVYTNTTVTTITPQVMFTKSLGTITSSGEHDITIPVDNMGLASFQGSVKDCNNNIVKNGTITLIRSDDIIVAHVPIVNGSYSSAIQLYTGGVPGGYVFLMRMSDDAGSFAVKDTAVILRAGKLDTISLNTCPTPTNLYINYTVDGTPYSLTGNAATPFSPMLGGYPGSPGTNYYCTSGAIGMQFTVNGYVPGTYSHVYNLWVNNGYYQRDLSKPCTITIIRYDLNVGGYMEGTFDFYYKDNQNISHRVVGSFRVKRIT